MEMGSRIRAIRKEQGLTLDDLARRSGVYKSNLSEIENGKRFKPNVKTLEKLAAALRCEVGDFFEHRLVPDEEMTQGLRDLLDDERTTTLLKITDEELQWLKGIRFRPTRRPGKETYIDLLYSYRKLEADDGWEAAAEEDLNP